jgi:hypothetical protein
LKGIGIAEIYDEMLYMLGIGLVIFPASVILFRKQIEG